MSQSNKTRLLAGVAAVGMLLGMAAYSVPAMAQDTSASSDAGTGVGELVIVGSRIKQDVYTSPSNVQIITRDDFTAAGFSSMSEILQSTQVTGGGSQINNAYGNFVTAGGPGANTLSLRGLGASRTLILLNGRRIAPAGTRGEVGAADLNVLPDYMVSQIQILKDGASSVYGSDAIAGVVNIITRPRIDGIAVEGQASVPTDGHGEEYRGSVAGGFEKGDLTVSGSYEYHRVNQITLGQRDWTKCQTNYWLETSTNTFDDFIDPATGKPKCYPIDGTGDNGVTINTIGTAATPGLGAAGTNQAGSIANFNRYRPNPTVTVGLVGYEGVGGAGNGLGPRDTFGADVLNESLVSPSYNHTAFVQGNYQLHALGNAELYFEELYDDRSSSQTGSRQLSLDYIAGTNADCSNNSSVLIPGTCAAGGAPTGLEAASAAFLPGKPGVRAFIDFGNDHSSQHVSFNKSTVGLRGDVPFKDWKYQVEGTFSYSKGRYTQESFVTDRVQNSLNVVAATTANPNALAGVSSGLIRTFQGTQYTCAMNVPGNAAYVANSNCIAAPGITAATIGGSLPQDYRDYIFIPEIGRNKYQEIMFNANATGTLFDLPAGSVKADFGVEQRSERIDDTPSLDSLNNNLYNLTASAPTRGTDSVVEGYGELAIPILKDIFLVKSLTANLSGRYTQYNSYGNGGTYKVGLNYQPFKFLTFRGNYGTSFRAPALYEQYLGATSGFQSGSNFDPCVDGGANAIVRANCASEGLPADFQSTTSIAVINKGGAGSGLKAEKSINSTFGVVINPPLPSAWGTLQFSADFYHIKINNGVQQAPFDKILDACYNDPQFRAGGGLCNLIEPRGIDQNGQVSSSGATALTVFSSYTNVSDELTSGIDFNLEYQHPIYGGMFKLDAYVTDYMHQQNRLFPTDDITDYNGTINTPKYVGELDLSYRHKEWRFHYGVEWSAATNSYGDQITEVDPGEGLILDTPNYYTHNISVEYTNVKGWDIEVGARNLFNVKPPQISSLFYDRVGNAPLYSGYDYIGRRVFVNLTKKF